MSSILPSCFNWPSAVGNYLLNFSMLDLCVLNFVKRRLPVEDAEKLERLHFQDRVKRMRQMVEEASDLQPRQAQFQALLAQMEKLRDLRNFLAHGVISLDVKADGDVNEVRLCLRQPRDIGKPEALAGRGLSFEELLAQLKPLADLVGQLQELEGGCEVTVLSDPARPHAVITGYLHQSASAPTVDS